MKRIISIVLSAIIMLSVLTVLSGCGEKGSEGLEYRSNGDGTCAVIGIGTCQDEDLVIPQKSPAGDKVTSIGDEAFSNAKIRTVKMADSITEIGVKAFSSCQRLESIDFSSSLRVIKDRAFYYCDTIEEFTLPESLEEFARSTFSSTGEEYENSYTFAYCKSLRKINIPKNLKAIYSGTFDETALSEVKIDADFKYADFDVRVFGEEPTHLYESALYLSKPDVEDHDIVELTEGIKPLIYADVFYNESVIVNGTAISIPKAQTTPGFYGAENSYYAYKITDDGKIEEYRYDSTHGKYNICSEQFALEWNETLESYVVKVNGKITHRLVVFDNNLFLDNGHYKLNVEKKD